MDNFNNFREYDIDPHLLARSLLQKSLIEQPDLFKAFQFFLFKHLQAGIAFYRINQFKHSIELIDYKGKLQNSFELPSGTPFKIEWIPFSPNFVACFDFNGNFEGLIERKNSGLNLQTASGGYLYNNIIYSLNSWLCELIPKNEISIYPYDLYIPSVYSDYIFATDRGSGKLLIIDRTLSKLVGKLQIRKPGSKKTINVAYLPATKCCYITDNQTPDIVVINLEKMSIDRFYQNYGTLGNITLNPKTEKLYVFLCQPDVQPAIIILKLPLFTLESTIILSGKRFSDLDDPTDLLALSADGRFLFTMTYTDRPSLFTPMLSIINTENNKLHTTHSLKQEGKPIALVSKIGNFVPSEINFAQILLEKGLVKPEELKAVIHEILGLAQVTSEKIELDKDVIATTSNLTEELSKEIEAISDVKKEVADKWLTNPRFLWEGRKNMTTEEKTMFIQKVSEISAQPEVAKANSVFVLKWLQDFFS